MTTIAHASAYVNNEVAFIAWDLPERLPGCLGFEIIRHYVDANGQVTESVPLAAYVAFKGQSNPDWKAQNTSVWPVQKLSWRDLTLRKRRDGATRRPDEVRVKYAIRPVGHFKPGMTLVVPRQEMTKDVPNTYQGSAVKLAYLEEPVITNTVLVTRHIPPFQATFTNGILSGQWLSHALKEDDGKVGEGELTAHLKTVGDAKRNYLAGDVRTLISDFFNQPDGRFFMALYELEDEELEGLIHQHAARISLILSNTGLGADDDPDTNVKIWDDRNKPARDRLIELQQTVPEFQLQHRMFNNNGQIGHNKFIVWVDKDNQPQSVLTGSTNFTWSGLTGQSNNCTRIDIPDVAHRYVEAWNMLNGDVQPLPDPLGAPMPKNYQGGELRSWAHLPKPAIITGAAQTEIWYSPNMPQRKYPKDPVVPPDLDRVFNLMRQAQDAILFLAFYPSVAGVNSIIEQAVNLGKSDSSLLVVGAVSSAQAMFNYRPGQKTTSGEKLPADSPYVYRHNKVSVVRASALTDKSLMKPFGDFQKEILKVGQAIIHDKILVIDPLDPERCTVVFGSHNLGFKASYSNDENLVIVRGHRALAEAYAVHILDVYDHYRFRAATAQLEAEHKDGWDGFLALDDKWQDHSSRDISAYFSNRKD